MIFFFKQKTAYEMRISDWSSDVCSSDLLVILCRHYLDRNFIDFLLKNFTYLGQCATLEFLLYTHSMERRDFLKKTSLGIAASTISFNRSEERRVGKECVCTCRSWWST